MYRIVGADNKQYGPVSAEMLRQWIADGRANGLTQVLLEGTNDWKPLLQFPEFAAALSAAAGPTGPPSPPRVARTNGFAVASLVLGLISATFGLCCCYGLPFNLLGFICAVIAFSQISADPQYNRGKGLAVAGMVLSILSVIIALLFHLLGMAVSQSDFFKKMDF
jgi:hypothetical protein